MGGHAPDPTPFIMSTPRPVPAAAKMGGIALAVIGLAATGYGFVTDADRTFTAFITNFMYWAGISQGAFMLAVALVIVKGRWGRPLKRIAEGMSLFMPVLYVFMILFILAGGMHIYPWTHEDLPAHKAVYLTNGFWIARVLGGLALLIFLNLLFLRASLRADLGVAGEALGAKAPGWWSKLTGGWKGKEVETAENLRKQVYLAPVVAIVYAFVFSFVAIDVSMSLAPHWFANMFPAWYFMSCFWSGLVWIGIISLISRNWLGTGKLFSSSMYHDLGKLTFGFTMFWAYTTFAQYLAIWYGNMTEETGFILLRTELEPWAGVTKVVVMLCFFVPFTMLLSRSLKKMPSAYLAVSGIIAVGIWLERYIVVTPSVWTKETLPLGIPELGMTVFFLGLFIIVVTQFLSRVPPVPIADPFMAPDPDHVHVLPASQAHAAHH